jgi:hypothetical protein
VERRFVGSSGFSLELSASSGPGRISHDDLVALEQSILADPQAGDLVPGTGWPAKDPAGPAGLGRGKRGGVRVYHLDLPRRGVTHLLAIFGKREKSDLTPTERRQVAELVKHLKNEEVKP